MIQAAIPLQSVASGCRKPVSRLNDSPPDATTQLSLRTPLSAAERVALDTLTPYLTPERQERFADVLDARTDRLTVVLEGLRQRHNYSAVLRSCEAFGVQTVHVVDPDGVFDISRNVAMGAHHWLRIEQSRELGPRLHMLKERGYQLVATTPHPPTTPLAEVDLSQPVALLLGNELNGLSDEAIAAAGVRMAIPTVGFVESLNVSVTAAVCLQSLTERLRATDAADWRLPPVARERLLLEWTRRSVRSAEPIEQAALAAAGFDSKGSSDD